jgi:hypothetical protein
MAIEFLLTGHNMSYAFEIKNDGNSSLSIICPSSAAAVLYLSCLELLFAFFVVAGLQPLPAVVNSSANKPYKSITCAGTQRVDRGYSLAPFDETTLHRINCQFSPPGETPFAHLRSIHSVRQDRGGARGKNVNLGKFISFQRVNSHFEVYG